MTTEKTENTLQVESWSVDDVYPYERNVKIHSPEQVKKIANAIKEYGWDQPIAIDESGVIIKGHGRRLAALHLGMRRVPVVVRRDLTPEQVRAARLADNRVAEGDMDTNLLEEELADLADFEIDMEAMGFDERELAFLTEDLDEMADDAFIDDLDEEVERHTDESEKKVGDAKEKRIKLSEAFGFRDVPVAKARLVNRFMAAIEEETGKEGEDALVEFLEQWDAE